jgi:putative membrane protein
MTDRPPVYAAALFVMALLACESDQTTLDSANAKLEAAVAALDTTRIVASEPPLTDANIFHVLDEANAADSARGRLADTKATDTEVKTFGRLMMGEHHALRLEGRSLAARLKISPQAPAGDEGARDSKAILDSLVTMPKGEAWDKAYIDREVSAHRAVIETATRALTTVENPELKALIERASPILQRHLQQAEELQRKLGGS